MNDNGLHGLELRSRISGDSVQAIPSGRHQSRAKTCEGPFVTGRTSSASFKVIRSLRPPDQTSLWQDSWGFCGGRWCEWVVGASWRGSAPPNHPAKGRGAFGNRGLGGARILLQVRSLSGEYRRCTSLRLHLCQT